MAIDHLLAVVPVSDIDASRRWYTALFGRDADNNPMPTLVEWQVVSGGWAQVFVDAERCGTGLLNVAVDDLEGHLEQLRGRGLQPEPIVDASKGVRLSALTDPDGNRVGIIGGFRVQY
ncbi:VOC family protein [Mycolicibacterium sp. S2-37]|uniref:VOC family protein n=1 Tax=Mycolicibacterium sp. S2-37 TaxID=2810297 RepID=UPI001A94F210|nr:VOC family protein [Mycolicibacterium sp. S2-37]MBO0679932.1 VOC family protein [Mycolicibacterium sp. S2-37]